MVQELFHSLSADSGYGEHLDSLWLEFVSQLVKYDLRVFFCIHRVHLVGGNHLRTL